MRSNTENNLDYLVCSYILANNMQIRGERSRRIAPPNIGYEYRILDLITCASFAQEAYFRAPHIPS